MKVIGGLFKLIGLLVVVAVGAAIYGSDQDGRSRFARHGGGASVTAATLDAPAPGASAAATPAAAAPAPMSRAPADQVQFLEIVERFQAQHNSATTDMQRGATRPARKTALCAHFKRGLAVRNWVGQIRTLDTNGEGKGVLEIGIGEDHGLGTWNNSLPDLADHTLIEPGTALYDTLLRLQQGQWVRFSGTFLPGDTDCVREMSMTLTGSVTDPEWTFRFSQVAPL